MVSLAGLDVANLVAELYLGDCQGEREECVRGIRAFSQFLED